MRKIYLSIILTLFFCVSNAQTTVFEDNFDSYTTGDLSGQSSHWAIWAGGTSTQVTDAKAASGSQSMLVGGNQTDDMLLLLGQHSGGVYSVQFDVFIPTGKTGYYNIQQFEDVAEAYEFAGEFFIGSETGYTDEIVVKGDIGNGNEVLGTASFPRGEWFTLINVIDLYEKTLRVFLNGDLVLNLTYPDITDRANLGAIDFFSANASNEMYVDNVIFAEGSLSTHAFSTESFSVYPNPIKDVLYVQSKTAVDAITVYDLLGKVVLQSEPGTMSPSINTSSLNSGVYLVKITIGNNSKTLKVIK